MDVDQNGAHQVAEPHGEDESGVAREDDSSSDECDYETDEEFYVVASLPAGVLQKAQDRAAENGDGRPKYAIIGMDTDRPLLEIEGMIHQGVCDELLGTSMVFKVETSDDSEEKAKAEFVAKTSRVVKFHAVKIRRRAAQ
ncbi:hypothetical protein GQ54DRAFT_258567 [Martensiomyces pterosporus]|nr:hypothetical protein GQ54DRAFT_258567 [Martensiomyces pterosporus]